MQNTKGLCYIKEVMMENKMKPSKELDLYITTRDEKRINSEEAYNTNETKRRISLAVKGKEYSSGNFGT